MFGQSFGIPWGALGLLNRAVVLEKPNVGDATTLNPSRRQLR